MVVLCFLESTGLSQKCSWAGILLHWQEQQLHVIELPEFTALRIARIFPFLNKMMYSSLSYRKETMGKEDEVCQEQCIPFISVFSLTREKCIIITERSKCFTIWKYSQNISDKIFFHQKEPKHCCTENRNESMAVILDRLLRLKEQEKCQEMPVSGSRGWRFLWASPCVLRGVSVLISKCHELFWHNAGWKHRFLNNGKIN